MMNLGSDTPASVNNSINSTHNPIFSMERMPSLVDNAKRRTPLLMSARRGLPDRLIAVLLLPFVAAVLFVILPIALLIQGRPLFYGSERMREPTQSFILWKLRTMDVDLEKDPSVLGGHMAKKVTAFGEFARRTRLDELPQIYNLIKGDIRLIGPRPPLKKYVLKYPELYRDVLRSKPGITGLSTITIHRREARLLADCRTESETDTVYCRACIPIKARLDRIYQENQSLRLDIFILIRTFSRLRLRKINRVRHAIRTPHRARASTIRL